MILEHGQRVLREEAKAIEKMAETLGTSFETAAAWILRCQGRVITCGVGKSGHIARKTAGTLASTGTPSLFLHASEAVHGDLGMVTNKDIVILYSHSGETDELVRLFVPLQAIGATTILISGRAHSSAGCLADLVLDTGVLHEACPNNLAPTTSTTAMLALSDALAVAIMEQRGFSKEDFAKFHPSGALGKRLLLRVTDVMRTGDDCPMLPRSTSLLDVMQQITKAGAGAALVVEGGELLGLISDGDLRRHFISSERPFDATAGDLMNAKVATIDSELLAIEALEAFQNHPKKIGEMPVLADGKPVGLIMLKDLLRSGIV